VLTGLLISVLLILGVVVPTAIAQRHMGALEDFYGGAVVRLVSRNNGATLSQAPTQPRGDGIGRSAYIASCSQCHGASGDAEGAFGPATHPAATDLTSRAVIQMSDAELFWIVKNGLSFTGMPSYARQYSDEDIADVVSYIRTLQSVAH